MVQDGSKADIAGFGMINVTTKANSDILQMAELKVILIVNKFRQQKSKK